MAVSGTRIISVSDWSEISELDSGIPGGLPSDVSIANRLDAVDIEEFGIYSNKNKCYTSGFVGIQRLKDASGRYYIYNDGNQEVELVVEVHPRFKNLDQWEMLSSVLQDPEYEKYAGDDSEKFYKIFFDEPPIKAASSSTGGELILVISFLRVLQSICRKRLKSKMSFKEENINGNIRGTISFQKQIRENVIRGREDRIYCRYPEFSLDTLENRILKKACYIAGKIISEKHIELPEVKAMYIYCKHSLEGVSNVDIKLSDFKKATTTGFNACYKQPIELAKLLINHCGFNYTDGDVQSVTSEIIPYAIKMEALFEYYIRTKIKRYIRAQNLENKLRLAAYKRPGEDGALTTYDDSHFSGKRPYLMFEYIPDILIQRKNDENEWKNIAVYDVKYQHSMTAVQSTTRRHNTHQLMFYTLLLNVNKCGFIFPRDNDTSIDEISCDMILQDGVIDGPDRHYTQWQVDVDNQEDTIGRIITYVNKLSESSI